MYNVGLLPNHWLHHRESGVPHPKVGLLDPCHDEFDVIDHRARLLVPYRTEELSLPYCGKLLVNSRKWFV